MTPGGGWPRTPGRRSMGRVGRIAAAGALAAGCLMVAASRSPARPAPPWVLHAERFPGGLSQGVRAYALAAVGPTGRFPAPEVASASPRAAGTPLVNVQMNSDARPPLPQNETAVAYDLSNPMDAVAAANDYVDGGLWIGHTSNGGQSWSSLFQSPEI